MVKRNDKRHHRQCQDPEQRAYHKVDPEGRNLLFRNGRTLNGRGRRPEIPEQSQDPVKAVTMPTNNLSVPGALLIP